MLNAYKQLYVAIKGDFLVPPHYPGHEHTWVALDAGMSICTVCGAEHVCFQGHCPMVQMEHSERVCSITGCVIVLSELTAEWGALDRVHSPAPSALTKTHYPLSALRDVHDTVEMVVQEILDSPKTLHCMAEERERDDARKLACLSKLIKEVTHHHDQHSHGASASSSEASVRPNMLDFEAKLSWQCRKCRAHLPQARIPICERRPSIYPVCHIQARRAEILQRVIRICVDSICHLIQNHGWHRVARQLQHATRGREFICSMLYLMRMGITFRNQNILQKMEILNDLLPLQVFLPTTFNIRAKSITEGENIIKLDIQRMPL